MSAITHGPPLNVLRASPANAATPPGPAAGWANAGYVDFIADCGADPTGTNDCGPAIATAATLLKTMASLGPKYTLTLYVPPGIYKVTSYAGVQDFGAFSRSIRVVGEGDASIFQIGVGAGNYIFAWINMVEVFYEDLSFVGTSTNSVVPDAEAVIYSSPTSEGHFSGLRFQWVLANAALVQDNAGATFDACFTGGCGSLGNGGHGGLFWSTSASAKHVTRDCVFSDLSNFLDFTTGPLSKITLNGPNVAEIRVDGSAAIGSSTQQRLIEISGSYFDEGVTHNIMIVGGSTANIPFVRMKGNFCNPPSNGVPPNGNSVVLTDIDTVEIDGHICSGFTTIDSGAAIALSGVGVAKINNLEVNNSSSSNYITADAACTYLEVRGSQSLLASGDVSGTIQSLAKTTRVQASIAAGSTVNEVWTDLVKMDSGSSAVATVAAKIIAGGGYAECATTDPTGAAVGVFVTSGSGGQRILVARGIQRIPVVSDGTTAITEGNPVTLSTTTGGFVMKAASTGTTPCIGIAATPAASGGGPVNMDIIFQQAVT
jgi:hypothetical protein